MSKLKNLSTNHSKGCFIKMYFKIASILVLTSMILISCNKNEGEVIKEELPPSDKISVKDVNFNAEEDDNSILLYMRLQEEFAITLKQFNNLFKDYLSRRGIDRAVATGQIPSSAIESYRQSFFLQIINTEVLYQEGLRTPEIVITSEEIEKYVAKEMIRNNKTQGTTFEEYLQRRNLTRQELSKMIKKDLYIKKVLADHMKFMTPCTPSEIEDLYTKLSKEGKFTSGKFREVYIIEYPFSMAPISQNQIDEIKDLAAFQAAAKEESIHPSAKKDGRIEDVPNKRSADQLKNKDLISNLFFEEIWQYDIGKPYYLKVDERQFLIWVNKEFEKQNQMTTEVQQYLIRSLNMQKKGQLEQEYSLKIAGSFSFKVRYKNKLVPLDLKKFFLNSINSFQDEE